MMVKDCVFRSPFPSHDILGIRCYRCASPLSLSVVPSSAPNDAVRVSSPNVLRPAHPQFTCLHDWWRPSYP